MNLTLYEAGETTERVSFRCPGCGRDITIHAGTRTTLPEKRCLNCRGTARSGRGGTPLVKGQRIGTHEGRRKDRKDGATGEQQRQTKRAASQRNRMRKAGIRLSNQTTHRAPCGSYDECSHKKHRLFTARR